ncbi:hypothetical protein D3C71_1672530 [compost metagenome]
MISTGVLLAGAGLIELLGTARIFMGFAMTLGCRLRGVALLAFGADVSRPSFSSKRPKIFRMWLGSRLKCLDSSGAR